MLISGRQPVVGAILCMLCLPILIGGELVDLGDTGDYRVITVYLFIPNISKYGIQSQVCKLKFENTFSSSLFTGQALNQMAISLAFRE